MSNFEGRKTDRMFWYDIESTGVDTKKDSAITVAFIITDGNFNQLERHNLAIRPRMDTIPHPMAFAVHQISMNELLSRGISEYEAITFIQNKAMESPNTAICGFNSISFDDEMIRATLFRNLMDPYQHEWKNGNYRFDIYNLVQMTYAFTPDVIEFPVREDGIVSTKLEDLSKANGIIHEFAHDALSDVEATISLAQMIRDKRPALFDYTQSLTNKNTVTDLLNQNDILFHTSSVNGKDRAFTKPVHPLVFDAKNKSAMYCIDLSASKDEIEALSQMTPEEINKFMYTKREELPEGSPRIPIVKVAVNKAPGLTAATNQMLRKYSDRFVYDPVEVQENLSAVNSMNFKGLIQQGMTSDMPKNEHPYEKIYEGFASPNDKKILETLHNTSMSRQSLPKFMDMPIMKIIQKISDKEKYGPLMLLSKWNNSLTDQLKSDFSALELTKYVDHLEKTMEKGEMGAYTFAEFEKDVQSIKNEIALTDDQQQAIGELENYVYSLREATIPQMKEMREQYREQAQQEMKSFRDHQSTQKEPAP